MRRLLTCSLIALLAMPALAAASGNDVIQDCNDNNVLDKTYTQAEYTSALKNLPADLDEYTDCRAIIKRARLSGASTTPKSGAATEKPKPEISPKKKGDIQRALNNPALATPKPLKLGDAVVSPDSLASSSSLPAPLIVVLVLAGIGALGTATGAIRRFVSERRQH